MLILHIDLVFGMRYRDYPLCEWNSSIFPRYARPHGCNTLLAFYTVPRFIYRRALKHTFVVPEHGVVGVHDLSADGTFLCTNQDLWHDTYNAMHHRFFSFH